MMSSGAIRLTCPNCGRFLGVLEGQGHEYPPCQCGVQITVRVTKRRLRRDSRPA